MNILKLIIALALFLMIQGMSKSQKITEDSLALILQSINHDTIKGKTLLSISDQVLYSNPDSSFILAKKALPYLEKDNKATLMFWLYRTYGFYYQNTFQADSARKYFFISLDYAKKSKSQSNVAQCFGSIGNTFYHQGKYDSSLVYYKDALETFRELGHERGEAISHAVIGNVYMNIENLEKALESYNLAEALFKKNGLEHNWAMTIMNIGTIYKNLEENENAIENFLIAIEVFEKLDSKVGLGQCYSTLGEVYLRMGEFNKCINLQKKAIELFSITQASQDKLMSMMNLAAANDSIGDTDKAIEYGLQVYEENKELKFNKIGSDITEKLYFFYKKQRDFQKSLKFLEEYIIINDTINARNNREVLDEYLVEYETKNKSVQIELLKKEKEIQQSKLLQKNLIIFFGALLVFLSLLLILFQYRNIRKRAATNKLLQKQKEEILEQQEQILEQNEELKQQKSEIEAQREEIQIQRDYVVEQRDKIAEKNNQIEQSIRYASNIQKGILQPNSIPKNLSEDYFIFYKPKDVVSGDFYWIRNIEGKTIIAIADCTGHGVPGAFMSLMGVTFLNNIISKIKGIKPCIILKELRNELLLSLFPSEGRTYPLDGMDISVAVIDNERNTLSFAGINIPLFTVQSGAIEVMKPKKGPAGIYHLENDTPCEDIEIKNGTMIYMFSDGFIDQFGGNQNRKYGIKRFKQTLLNCSHVEMSKQKFLLKQELEEWKGNNQQVDDILVFGMQFK